MNKKAAIGMITIVGLLFGPAPARSQMQQEKFSLRIAVEYGSAGFGDLDRAEEGHNARLSDLANLWGFEKAGNLALPHLGINLDGEIVLPIVPRLSLSLGLGRISRTGGESRVTLKQVATGAETLISWTTSAAAIPLTLNAYYRIPISPRLSGFLKAGLGCYFASLKLTSYRKSALLGVETWSRTISQERDYALGYQVVLGMEAGLSSFLSFFTGAGWRSANFKNWNVQYDYSSTALTDDTRTASCWAVEELNRDTGKYYPGFLFSDQEPTSTSYRNVRKAEIDFSGWSLQVGLRFRFGK